MLNATPIFAIINEYIMMPVVYSFIAGRQSFDITRFNREIALMYWKVRHFVNSVKQLQFYRRYMEG